MKKTLPLYMAIALALPILIIAGCNEADKETLQETSSNLAVVDSLLGETYRIPTTGKEFRPPAGFEVASDTILEMLRRQLEANSGGQEGIEMVRCYLDTVHTAGLLISTIEGINFGVDTTGFLQRYRAKLDELFGEENISEDNFWTGGVLTKRFFVADSIIVRVQLLCFSNDGNAAELSYFTPREQYPDLVNHFNASIASIGLVSRDD